LATSTSNNFCMGYARSLRCKRGRPILYHKYVCTVLPKKAALRKRRRGSGSRSSITSTTLQQAEDYARARELSIPPVLPPLFKAAQLGEVCSVGATNQQRKPQKRSIDRSARLPQRRGRQESIPSEHPLLPCLSLPWTLAVSLFLIRFCCCCCCCITSFHSSAAAAL
jgi:hypothetical protein